MRTLRINALLLFLGILFITGTVMNGAVSRRVYAQEGDGQSFVPGGTVPGDGEQQPEEPAELPDADVVACLGTRQKRQSFRKLRWKKTRHPKVRQLLFWL